MGETIYFVIPCYNEEQVLPLTLTQFKRKLDQLMDSGTIGLGSRVIFVDDGSEDQTWEIIRQIHHDDSRFGGLKLSRNRGHQNALLAGLIYAKDRADAVISLDADLQDDIDAIDAFLAQYQKGYDIVYGVRSRRDTDSFFKRNTALAFYKLMQRMGVESVYNHADYRLMSQRALESLSLFREVNLFLRGLVPLVGFRSATVAYDRHERAAGESKYPFKKMLAFAIDGITSFSVKPLRLITSLGFVIFLLSILALVYALVSKLIGTAVPGWTALIASIWLIGGLQLLSIGVCGEYIGKIYNEVKGRPRFIIEETINIEN